MFDELIQDAEKEVKFAEAQRDQVNDELKRIQREHLELQQEAQQYQQQLNTRLQKINERFNEAVAKYNHKTGVVETRQMQLLDLKERQARVPEVG